MLAALLLADALLWPGLQTLRYDLRGYSLLEHFISPQALGPLLRLESRAFSVQDLSIPAPDGPIAARLYLPAGVAHPPGMVIVHGIHRLGIDEPRLVNLARAAAASGFAVLTPQVAALADYGVDEASIRTIGASPAWLENRLGSGRVTLMAVSFSGGLAMLAASDPQYAQHIRELVLIGAYDDLGHVGRFLATGEAELPSGSQVRLPAHEYGALVLIYSHLDRFFPKDDLPIAQTCLRYWLWEKPERAIPLLSQLGSPARSTMELLFDHKVNQLQPQLLAVINDDREKFAELSPAGHLGNLQVPVFILHGAEDDIIPYTESLWLAREVPRRELRDVLITDAFSHVNPAKNASWRADMRLVEFLGRVLRTANGRP